MQQGRFKSQERRQLQECATQCKKTDAVQMVSHFYGFARSLANVKYARPLPVYITEEAYARVVEVVDPVTAATERQAEVRDAKFGTSRDAPRVSSWSTVQ